MPIINGRLVTNVPDAGVYGQDIINELNLRPGRRPVLQKKSGFETVTPDRRYRKQDLIDRKGNPLKVSDIPDRSKGAQAPFSTSIVPRRIAFASLRLHDIPDRSKSGFTGARTPLSKQIITEQVYDLAEHMFKEQGVDFDEQGANWFVARNFRLPKN